MTSPAAEIRQLCLDAGFSEPLPDRFIASVVEELNGIASVVRLKGMPGDPLVPHGLPILAVTTRPLDGIYFVVVERIDGILVIR